MVTLISRMQIMFDFAKDQIIINSVEIPLDSLREYLILWYPHLVKEYFVKAIVVSGKTKFTYDWQTIFAKLEDSTFVIAEFFARYREHPDISLN